MNKVKNKVIMGQLKYKGYAGSVEYNEEDNCLFGKVLGLKKDCITYEGCLLYTSPSPRDA